MEENYILVQKTYFPVKICFISLLQWIRIRKKKCVIQFFAFQVIMRKARAGWGGIYLFLLY